MVELIAFRTVQGLGAGGLATGAVSLIGTLVPPQERVRYQGMTASVMALGIVGGPLIGGLITGHVGWRWDFYINLPLGVFALVWCQILLHLPRQRVKARIDWLGIVLMVTTISAFVLGATWAGSQYPWLSWQTLTTFAGALVALGLFLAWQRKAPEPVVPPRVFGPRNIRLAAIMIFTVGAMLFGCTLYLPLFQQTVQGAGATSSGLLLLPLMIAMLTANRISGFIVNKTGKYKMFPIIGAAALTAGCLLLSSMDTCTSRLVTSCFMALTGLGVGFLQQMTMTIMQNSADMKDMGITSGSVLLFRTFGGSLGVAIFGSLFLHALPQYGGGGATSAKSLTASMPPAAKNAYLHAIATGTSHIFLAAAALGAIAFTAAWFVKEIPLRSRAATPAAKAETAPAHSTS
jgi:MFS family permease